MLQNTILLRMPTCSKMRKQYARIYSQNMSDSRHKWKCRHKFIYICIDHLNKTSIEYESQNAHLQLQMESTWNACETFINFNGKSFAMISLCPLFRFDLTITDVGNPMALISDSFCGSIVKPIPKKSHHRCSKNIFSAFRAEKEQYPKNFYDSSRSFW